MSEIKHVVVLGSKYIAPHGADRMIGNGNGCKWCLTPANLDYACEVVEEFHPCIVLVRVDGAVDRTFAAAEQIAQNFPEAILVAASEDQSPHVLKAAMRAGIREILPSPVTEHRLMEVFASLEDKRVQAVSSAPSTAGKIVSVFSGKGGAGATTIAVNLAISVAKCTGENVALADIDLALGDVVAYMDLPVKYTIVDFVKELDRADHTLLTGSMARHEAGVYVLGEPRHIEDGESVTTDQMEQAVRTLAAHFRHVIVDTPHQFDDRTLRVLDMSDEVLLVSDALVPSLRHARRCLNLFDKLGYEQEKVKVIMNRFTRSGEIGIKEVEKALGRQVFWKIPEDSKRARVATNHGTPLCHMAPRAPVSVKIKELAHAICHFPALTGSRNMRQGLMAKVLGR